MHPAALILAATLATSASAQTIGLHLASWHSKPGFNNVNPGLYVRSADGWTLGGYRNSYDQPTVYAGWTLERDVLGVRAGLTAGLATGYEKPWLLVPSVSLPAGWARVRLAWIPRIRPGDAHVLHLAVETEL